MAPRPARSALERTLVGPAGEHYVLYQLYRRGLLASLAPPGTPVVDVLVLDTDGESIAATVQVKTRTYGKDRGWHMKAKHEQLVEDRMFYAFVDLEPEEPATFVVPSAVVADVLYKAHRTWLATPGMRGQPHNDGIMRRIRPAYGFDVPGVAENWLEPYAEAWDLISQRAGEPKLASLAEPD